MTQLGGLGEAGAGHSRHFPLSRVRARRGFLTALPQKPFLRCQHLSSSLTLWERSHPAVHPTRPLRSQVALMPGVTFQPDDHAALPREQRGASCLHSERTTPHISPWAFWGSAALYQLQIPRKLSHLRDTSVRGPTVDTNFPHTCPVTWVINSLVEISFPVLKYGMTENTAAGFTAPHGTQL